MPDRVQDLTNHRKVAVACKNYTDKEVKKAKDELITFFSRNTVDTDDHTNELAYQITTPSGAKLLQLQAIGGNTVKLSPSVASDSTKAMIKTMPSTVYTFDGSKFYGDSEVSENILPTNKLGNGVVFSNDIMSITNSSGGMYILKEITLPAGTYVFSFINYTQLTSSHTFTLYIDGTATSFFENFQSFTLNQVYTKSFTLSQTSTITIQQWQTGSETYSFRLWLNKDTAKDYSTYYNGIHNLELSGLKVESANLLNVNGSNTNGIYDSSGNVISNPNWTAYNDYIELSSKEIILSYTFTTRGQFNIAQYNSNKTFISILTYDVNSYTPFIPNLDNNCKYIRISYRSELMTNIMVNYGTTAKTYTSDYVAPTTLPIDLTSIEDSNGNKLFADGKLMGYNGLKDVLGVYNQESKWSEVDLGLQTIEATGIDTHTFKITLSSAKAPSDNDTLAKLLMANYEVVTYNSISTSGDMTMALRSDNVFVIRNNAYSTAESFKTAMSGVMLQFERNTYLTSNTDLSATLRNIQGYPNGSIIAENTNNMDVESVITYNSIIQETLCPSVTVDGYNRISPDNTFTYTGYGDLGYFECVGGETYTIRTFGVYTGNHTLFYYDGNSWNILTSHNLSNGYTLTAPSNSTRIGFNGCFANNGMAVNGSTIPTSYRPYKDSITRNLPTQSSDGYGVNANVHNLRVFSDYEGNETKERHIIAGKVDLGSLDWNIEVGQQRFVVGVSGLKNYPTRNDTLLCSKYNASISGTDKYIFTTNGNIYIYDSDYTDAITFKTAMSGVYLYYELATEDISQIDDFDFFFDVEEGDVITFNNPYAQQVYATYSFIIKEAKQSD